MDWGQPTEGLDQFGLPIALHPSDTDHLARRHVQIYFVQCDVLCVAIKAYGIYPQNRASEFGRRAVDIKAYGPANHQLGQICFGKLRRCAAADDFAAPQHIHVICNFKNFMQLMGNENNGFSCIPQSAHDAEKGIDFLRGQNGGWLIQNQHICGTEQDFQNFDPLL